MTTDNHNNNEGGQPGGGGTPTPTPADVANNAKRPKAPEFNYPKDTQLSEMTAEQQVEYWRHKARKHEALWQEAGHHPNLKAELDRAQTELDKLKAERMTEAEKAVEEARKEGRAEAASELGPKMAGIALRTALASRGIEAEEIDSKLSYVDFAKFLNDNGEVDYDKVQGYLGDIAPQQRQGQWIDMGQGRRDDTGGKRPGGSVEAGRDLRKNRHKQQA